MNRRILALLLAVVMILALAACKKNETPAESVPGVIQTPDFNDGGLEATPDSDDVAPVTEAPAETEAEEETASTEETQAPDTTEPAETTAPATEPEETTVPTNPAVQMTEYEWYNSLSGEEQMAFMESFDSVPAFFDWYNNAKAEHEKLHPDIEIGDGVIDLGGLVGGNG